MPINTTPETFELHEYLQRAVDNGVSLFVQEVSSQALKYERVGLLDFAYGVFTNFARDHISPAEHPDLEDYFASKLKLVQRADVAVICQDQPEFDRIRAAARNRVLTYGETAAADYYPDQIRQDGEWLTFTGHGRGLSLPLRIRTFGYINALNAMAAVAIAHDLGISPANIQAGLEKATVPGRMERLSSRDGSRVVIVDYAHNLSSYQALLKAIKREYPNHRTVFVYGCAGDKAYDRREQLGTFTGREVDLSVVTADDPGREGFAKIADEIIHHIELQNGDYLRIEDRETAIRTAILEAEPNSVIVTLGIGNHNFILIGDQDVPYKTDRLIAKEALQEYEQRL